MVRSASLVPLMAALAAAPVVAAAWSPPPMTEREKSAMWALHGAVACVVANAPVAAGALLRTEEGTDEERALLARIFTPSAFCAVPRDLGPIGRLRGIVAERLYRLRFAAAPNLPPADQAGPADPLARSARCMVAASPPAVDRLLRTQIDTDAEDAALASLMSVALRCDGALPGGTTLFALRAALGAAQFAWAAPAADGPSSSSSDAVIRQMDEQTSRVAAPPPPARPAPPPKDFAAPVAECLVRESPGLAAQALATLPGSEDSAQALNAANLDHCRMFSAPPLARSELRGAVAGQLWQRDFGPRRSGRRSVGTVFSPPGAAGLRALPASARQQTAMVLAGQCTAAAQSAVASALVGTVPGSDAETRAMSTLRTSWSRCTADAGLATTGPSRAAMLEGLYRDAMLGHVESVR